MTKELTNLFVDANGREATGNARSLKGTAELTNLSAAIAGQVLKDVNGKIDEYEELVTGSMDDHGKMDQLVSTVYDLKSEDLTFLKELGEDTLESMLKSQQSKRSRTKGKVRTMDNYQILMTAAIAENLVRLALGKEKQAVGARRSSGSVEFSPEELAALQEDQEKLRKEIRNVQSKKSIMKSKEGFSEDDERWQQLLEAEYNLKAIRVSNRTVVVDETKNQLADMLDGVEVDSLKAADAKKLIEQAMALLGKEKTDSPKAAEGGN